jgi:hypothetical protein
VQQTPDEQAGMASGAPHDLAAVGCTGMDKFWGLGPLGPSGSRAEPWWGVQGGEAPLALAFPGCLLSEFRL